MFVIKTGKIVYKVSNEEEIVRISIANLLDTFGDSYLRRASNIRIQVCDNITRDTRLTAKRNPEIRTDLIQLTTLDGDLIKTLVSQVQNHDWSKPLDIIIRRTEDLFASDGRRFSRMSKCTIKKC